MGIVLDGALRDVFLPGQDTLVLRWGNGFASITVVMWLSVDELDSVAVKVLYGGIETRAVIVAVIGCTTG